MNSDKTNSGSDFSGVKVGDRLWYMDREVGVLEIGYSDSFPLLVKDLTTRRCAAYTFKGQDQSDGPQVLFWDKVEIIPPPRPKRLVKKMIEVVPYTLIDGVLRVSVILDTPHQVGPEQPVEIEVWE